MLLGVRNQDLVCCRGVVQMLVWRRKVDERCGFLEEQIDYQAVAVLEDTDLRIQGLKSTQQHSLSPRYSLIVLYPNKANKALLTRSNIESLPCHYHTSRSFARSRQQQRRSANIAPIPYRRLRTRNGIGNPNKAPACTGIPVSPS
jgi:hypothetical protein